MFRKVSSQVDRNFVCNSYFELQFIILKCGGLWPIYHNTRPRNGISGMFLHVCGYLNVLILFLNLIRMIMSQIISIFMKGGSIVDISIHLQEVLVAVVVVGFQTCFFFGENQFINLIKEINKRLVNRSIIGITFVNMQRPFELSRTFTKFWTTMSIVATLHYSLHPILDGERRLPVPVVYPFDVMQSPYFEVEYFLQTLAQIQYGFVYSIIIGTVTTLTMLVSGQLDILYCNIHNLLYSAMIQRGDRDSLDKVNRVQKNWSRSNQDRIRYCYAIECYEDLGNICGRNCSTASARSDRSVEWVYQAYDKEVMELLKKCIQLHQCIIETVNMIEDFLRSILFLELIQHTLIICIVTYGLSIQLHMDNLFYHYVFYFFMVNFDTFLLCFTSHLMTEQVGEFLIADKKNCSLISYFALSIEHRIVYCHFQVAILPLWTKNTEMPVLHDHELPKGSPFNLWQIISG